MIANFGTRELSLKLTQRRSKMPGPGISRVELTNVSSHGLWLMIDDEELALPFDQFPWFRDATIAQLSAIERPSPDHLHWPLLDVDLTVPSIRDPAAWPLVAR